MPQRPRQLRGAELLALPSTRGVAPMEATPDAGRPARQLLLLDVREPWEVAIAAIRVDGLESRFIPMRDVPARLSELDPLQPVACICHHGMRSAQVVAYLAGHGFELVYNLAGGIDAWSTEVDPGVPRY